MVLATLASLLASNEKPRRGGSAPGRMKAKNRHRLEGYCMLYSYYFADAPLHDDKVFRRCYRMSRKLFLRIVNSIREFDSYFKCKMDCTGKLGFTSIQKCTTAMRMLAYGAPGDSLDDYGRMAESTTIECFLQVLQGSGGGVWTAILANTQCGRHCSDPSTKCSKRISWDAWKHRLHALEMEELPICLAGDVQRHQRRLQCGT